MTTIGPYYYNVQIENRAQAVKDTAEEALDYGMRAVYLSHERAVDVLALLKAGQVASWQYGFTGVDIIPVRRRPLSR